jgi:hypothetical protein
MTKLISICQALIVITVLTLCFSCSKKSDPTPVTPSTPSTPVSTDPSLTSVDKTSVINGTIITITGKNFSKNFEGGSQIVATNNSTSDQVYLPILSRTETQIVAVMVGSGAGVAGTYKLSYSKKPDANAATLYASSLNVTVAAPGVGQFFVSSTFIDNSVDKSTTASFGVKNGSTAMGDYTVKLIGYNYETGTATETNAAVTAVTTNGYGGTMDQVDFTVPADAASGQYEVRVTYTTNTLTAGWGGYFFVN